MYARFFVPGKTFIFCESPVAPSNAGELCHRRSRTIAWNLVEKNY